MWSNTGSVGHDVANVRLLVDAVEQMGPGAGGEDPDIVSAVGLLLQRNSAGKNKCMISRLVHFQILRSRYPSPTFCTCRVFYSKFFEPGSICITVEIKTLNFKVNNCTKSRNLRIENG